MSIAWNFELSECILSDLRCENCNLWITNLVETERCKGQMHTLSWSGCAFVDTALCCKWSMLCVLLIIKNISADFI